MPPPSSVRRILIVDDFELIRDLLSEVLTKAGYAVETARNGIECLKEIGDFHPDLVILDLAMPHIRGETVLNLIRGNESYRDLPVILMSGHGMRDSKEVVEALEYGTFIGKPFDVTKLIETVRVQLHK
jgi:DNA-binding response OmpR family regulator